MGNRHDNKQSQQRETHRERESRSGERHSREETALSRDSQREKENSTPSEHLRSRRRKSGIFMCRHIINIRPGGDIPFSQESVFCGKPEGEGAQPLTFAPQQVKNQTPSSLVSFSSFVYLPLLVVTVSLN